MKAKDTFTLTWCDKHENWWVTNCPDCMVDSNEEDIKRAGIREVVGSFAKAASQPNSSFTAASFEQQLKYWQAKLKEWGISDA